MTTVDDLSPLAAEVLDKLRAKGEHLATAESCTGGLIAGLITEIAGSSDVFDRGFVTYSNAAKTEMLDVPEAVISSVGAVSKDVAILMAEGALKNSNATLAVSVTGIAGPGGGTPDKPTGTVHMAVAGKNIATQHTHCLFDNLNRNQVRLETVRTALTSILNAVSD